MIEELAAYRAAKPLYDAAKSRLSSGEYEVDTRIRLIGVVKKGEPYMTKVAMRADPWKLLAVALSKLNNVTMETIVRESLAEDSTIVKAAADEAIARIVAATESEVDGRITGKVIMELL